MANLCTKNPQKRTATSVCSQCLSVCANKWINRSACYVAIYKLVMSHHPHDSYTKIQNGGHGGKVQCLLFPWPFPSHIIGCSRPFWGWEWIIVYIARTAMAIIRFRFSLSFRACRLSPTTLPEPICICFVFLHYERHLRHTSMITICVRTAQFGRPNLLHNTFWAHYVQYT